MKIHTIGFTGKTAEEFFGKLQSSEAKYLHDIRIHNTSQLAGFTKKGNIEYFLENLTHLQYSELKELAPTNEMFKEYRQGKDWELYASRYIQLLEERNISAAIDSELFNEGSVLLCSEPTPERCHRRLAAEYLAQKVVPEAEIVHL